MNPVIVIGVGGTGKEVLMYLRRKVVQRFGSLKSFPLLGYLHIDSDQSPESKAMPSTQYLGEDIALDDNERLLLTVTGGNSWKDNQWIREWFPPDLDIPSNFGMGCAAQRNYGRLLFSANIDAIRERIMTILAPQVTDPETHKNFGARQGVEVKPDLDVFIVSSLLGGTGSGMVFDLCYTVRHVLQGHNTLLHGYLVTGWPEALSDGKANCYAALMELDYYNKQGFRMQYPGPLLPQIQDTEGPVHWMYLVNGLNAEGVSFPPVVVWESVAENICAEVMPGLKDRRRSVRDDIRDASYGERDRLGKPQCYLSFGLASIEFPALNLQDALSYRLAAEALTHWPFTHAPQEDHLRLADSDLEAWRLSSKLLEADLLKEDDGISQLQRIRERTNHQKADCSQRNLLDRDGREDLREDLRVKVETYLRSNDADVEKRTSLAQSGARLQKLNGRRHKLLQEFAHNHLYPRVLALVTNEASGGVENARGYLEVLDNRLQAVARDCQSQQDRYGTATGQAYDKLQKELQGFREDFAEGKFVVRRHVEWVLDASGSYQQVQLKFTANEMARLLITGRQSATGVEKGFLTEISDLRKRVAEYERALKALSAQCRSEYDKRRASIMGSSGLADVMITDDEVEQIFAEAVREPLQMAIFLKSEVEESQGKDLFNAILDFPDNTVDALVRAAKEKFVGVRETSIANKLARLSPVERDNKLRMLNRSTHVLIQVDSERRQRYCVLKAPEKTHALLIGTPPPDMEPALAPKGSLREVIERQVTIPRDNFVAGLPDRSRLLFSRELGVFSLHCVKTFAEYRKIFRTAQDKRRQTHKGIAFPDLFPPEEEDVRKRAERAAVLAGALQLFAAETDPETQERALYYYYQDRHGRHPLRLGRDWQEVEEQLFASQKEKEILANSQGTTPLERLEEHFRQIGKEARTRPQKERLWRLLQDYLDAREAGLEGGLRHPRHQLETAHINHYRDEWDLTPAEGGVAPVRGIADASLPESPAVTLHVPGPGGGSAHKQRS